MARDSNLCNSFASAFASLLQWYVMTAFTSSITISGAQLASAPSFEHLLRNSTVHENTISVQRANEVVDRDTFVNMLDSEARSRTGLRILGLTCLLAGSHTQGNLLQLLQRGRRPRSWLIRNYRQTQLPKPTACLSLSCLHDRIQEKSALTLLTIACPLSQCSNISRRN